MVFACAGAVYVSLDIVQCVSFTECVCLFSYCGLRVQFPVVCRLWLVLAVGGGTLFICLQCVVVRGRYRPLSETYGRVGLREPSLVFWDCCRLLPAVFRRRLRWHVAVVVSLPPSSFMCGRLRAHVGAPGGCRKFLVSLCSLQSCSAVPSCAARLVVGHLLAGRILPIAVGFGRRLTK